jgi:4-amino-4-deoxy-L-arabinose transferase-like glycosyltransferase
MFRFRNPQTIWDFLIISTASIGLTFLVVSLVPHPVVKAWMDSLTPDGSLESFTPAIFVVIKRILFPQGLAAILIAIWLVNNRRRANRILSNSLDFLQKSTAVRLAEIRQFQGFVRDTFADTRYRFGLLGITGIGIWLRVGSLSRQVSHDEAYTFMAFVSMGLRQIITDYHLPNNHVFHSILVWISSEFFGIQPWAIRMPAFTAGVLLIPASFFVALAFYDKQTALISAGWVASIPVLIGYATNARGYSLIALFFMVLVGLGAYLSRKKNLVGWIAFILLAVLGFYTIPIMLYPFGLVLTWITLAGLFKLVGPDYKDAPISSLVIRTLIPVGIAVTGLVILVYTPIFLHSGIQSVVGNGFVESMEWEEFLETIPVRITNTWREWNSGLPEAMKAILVLGLGGSIFNTLTRKPTRMPLAAAGLIWIGSTLVIQRVAPWPRVWVFLLPWVLISSAAGLMWIARSLKSRLPGGEYLPEAVFAFCLLVPLALGSLNAVNEAKHARGELGNIEELAFFLKDYIGPEDVILVTAPDAVIVRYYLKQYEIEGDQVFFRDDEDYRHVLAIVNQRYNQTLESVMQSRSSTAEIDPGNARVVFQKGKVLVYEIILDQNASE